ncbi:SDR family NAD(P)-dependent oxidoreductase [bacterium]|nr:MAG: SDR family NAD(P)-dependent oxidoreductase [bacterium]
MKITGNTILITGGTSGIGRGLAQALHERDNRVIIAGRRQNLLDDITTNHPGMAGLQLDLGSPTSLSHLADEVEAHYPELNVLVANAGISRSEDLTSDEWDASIAQAIIETNILGVLRVTAALLPILKKRPDATIIVTTSNLAIIPLSAYPTYCASKAFLHSWLQSLRHQLRDIPVEVLELSPPYVQTELTGEQQASDPRAIPLPVYISEVIHLLETHDHPRGEILVAHDRQRRFAEQEGRYDAAFAAINPT